MPDITMCKKMNSAPLRRNAIGLLLHLTLTGKPMLSLSMMMGANITLNNFGGGM